MKSKVLLIDDSVTIHRVIDLSIDVDRYDIVKVFSKEDAALKMQAERYDYILLDNKLDNIIIAEYIKELKAVQPSASIILLVGAFDRFDESDLEKIGADDYLVKPFDSQSLNEKLSSDADMMSADIVEKIAEADFARDNDDYIAPTVSCTTGEVIDGLSKQEYLENLEEVQPDDLTDDGYIEDLDGVPSEVNDAPMDIQEENTQTEEMAEDENIIEETPEEDIIELENSEEIAVEESAAENAIEEVEETIEEIVPNDEIIEEHVEEVGDAVAEPIMQEEAVIIEEESLTDEIEGLPAEDDVQLDNVNGIELPENTSDTDILLENTEGEKIFEETEADIPAEDSEEQEEGLAGMPNIDETEEELEHAEDMEIEAVEEVPVLNEEQTLQETLTEAFAEHQADMEEETPHTDVEESILQPEDTAATERADEDSEIQEEGSAVNDEQETDDAVDVNEMSDTDETSDMSLLEEVSSIAGEEQELADITEDEKTEIPAPEEQEENVYEEAAAQEVVDETAEETIPLAEHETEKVEPAPAPAVTVESEEKEQLEESEREEVENYIPKTTEPVTQSNFGGISINISREEIMAMLGNAIDKHFLEEAVKEVLAANMKDIVKNIVPAIAEKYIKEEIERLKNDE